MEKEKADKLKADQERLAQLEKEKKLKKNLKELK